MTDRTVSMHRFRSGAGLSITGDDGLTVYLNAKEVRQLARDFARLARSVEREAFTEHTFSQTPVTCHHVARFL